MRKQFLLIGAAVFFAALNAQARIGYTLEQCTEKYGKEYKAPVRYLGMTWHSFSIHGVRVACVFIDGTDSVAMVGYWNSTQWGAGEIKELLKLNFGEEVDVSSVDRIVVNSGNRDAYGASKKMELVGLALNWPEPQKATDGMFGYVVDVYTSQSVDQITQLQNAETTKGL